MAAEVSLDFSTIQKIQNYLNPHGLTLPVEEFVDIVSNEYHRHESSVYNRNHVEIFQDRTPELWNQILTYLTGKIPSPVSVLDIGCGTGFASQRILEVFTPNRIRKLVCLEPSQEMLVECQANLMGISPSIEFFHGSLGDIEADNQFDLVITNSVLHHILHLEDFLSAVNQFIKPGGFYVCGHEPNARFYHNRVLVRWASIYGIYNRLVKKARRIFPAQGKSQDAPLSIADKVIQELIARGYITKPLSGAAISKLVDIHVPYFNQGTDWGYPGLSDTLVASLSGLVPLHTLYYHYIRGSRKNFLWQRIDAYLGKKYYQDGRNFIAVLQKPERSASTHE